MKDEISEQGGFCRRLHCCRKKLKELVISFRSEMQNTCNKYQPEFPDGLSGLDKPDVGPVRLPSRRALERAWWISAKWGWQLRRTGSNCTRYFADSRELTGPDKVKMVRKIVSAPASN
jgi:hypothetical protein